MSLLRAFKEMSERKPDKELLSTEAMFDNQSFLGKALNSWNPNGSYPMVIAPTSQGPQSPSGSSANQQQGLENRVVQAMDSFSESNPRSGFCRTLEGGDVVWRIRKLSSNGRVSTLMSQT